MINQSYKILNSFYMIVVSRTMAAMHKDMQMHSVLV
nr:MAG TPA: hypothetical protein [Caudoviricetes sp.]